MIPRQLNPRQVARPLVGMTLLYILAISSCVSSTTFHATGDGRSWVSPSFAEDSTAARGSDPFLFVRHPVVRLTAHTNSALEEKRITSAIERVAKEYDLKPRPPSAASARPAALPSSYQPLSRPSIGAPQARASASAGTSRVLLASVVGCCSAHVRRSEVTAADRPDPRLLCCNKLPASVADHTLRPTVVASLILHTDIVDNITKAPGCATVVIISLTACIIFQSSTQHTLRRCMCLLLIVKLLF
jgi:hypothetical protein